MVNSEGIGEVIQLPKYEKGSLSLKDNTTKIKDLITALQQLNPELAVMTEGCDCYGNAVALEFDNEIVLIRRDN